MISNFSDGHMTDRCQNIHGSGTMIETFILGESACSATDAPTTKSPTTGMSAYGWDCVIYPPPMEKLITP